MSNSKPEELVARLYETGMSDDEVRKQLEDFGLSRREIHNLMKKAQDYKTDSNPQESSDQKPQPKKGGLGGLFGGKKEQKAEPSADFSNEPEFPPPLGMPPEPLPSNALDMSSFDDIPDMPEEVAEKKPLDQLFPSKPTAPTAQETKPKEKKGRFGGLFGGKKKEDKDKKKGKKEDTTQDKKKEDKDKKKGKKEDKKKDKKSGDVTIDGSTMKRLSMIKASISKPVDEKPKAKEKEEPKKDDEVGQVKPRLWKPQQENQEEEEPFSLIPDKKEPQSEVSKENLKWMHPEDRKKLGDEDISETKKKLTPQEQEKMDEETAKNLKDGMDKLQGEMSEIKDLLDTLRELNIKLIEILEKK